MRVAVAGLFLMTGDLAPLTRTELDEIRCLIAEALVAAGAADARTRVILGETVVPDGARMITCCIESRSSAVRPARVYGVGTCIATAARTAAELLTGSARRRVAATPD
jgi:hypothetical protein